MLGTRTPHSVLRTGQAVDKMHTCTAARPGHASLGYNCSNLKYESFTNVFPSSAKVVVFEVVRTAESQKFQKQQGSCFISLVRKTSQQYSKQRQTVPASDSVPAVTTIVVSRYILRINSDLSRRGTEARLLRRLPTCWRGPQICNVWE